MALNNSNNSNNKSNPNTVNPYSQQDAERAEQMTFAARSLTEELKDQLGIRSRLNETEKAQLNLARAIQRSASENTVEIGNQGNISRQLTKDRKMLLKVENEKLGILKSTTAREQSTAKRIFQAQSKIQKLQDKLASASGIEADNIKLQMASKENQLAGILSLASADSQRLALAYGMEDTTKALIGQREKEADIQKEINNKMGVSGALVKGTGALMERLGMRSGIFNDAMTESAEVMASMAEESTRLVDIVDQHGNITRGTLENYNKMEIMLAGFSKLSKGFGKALKDPFTVITAIFNAFLDVNKAAVEFTRETGQSSKVLNGTVTEASNLVDLMNTAAEITKQTGLNAAAIFSPEQLGQLSDAKNLLGLSSEEASNLGSLIKLSNSSAENFTDTVLNGVTAMNGSTDSAVANKVVLQDVLSASEDITASLGGSPEKLMAAAHAARRLGMELVKVNQIADGLMNFEDSIGNELEAQLLTGKNINLNKARELALNNDLEGVAKELAKNGATAAEYAKMNRIQQESLAKALGMSRSEMGKMVIAQAAQGDLTDEQREKILGVNSAQLQQMDIQTRIQKSISMMAQAFAPVLEAVVPIVEALLIVVGPIAAGIGKFANLFSGIVGPLTIAVGLLYTMNTLNGLLAASQVRLNLAKSVGLGLGGQTLALLGLQSAALTYNEARQNQSNILTAIGLTLQKSTLVTMIRQGYVTAKNIVKDTVLLGIKVAKAVAEFAALTAASLGMGTLPLLGLAAAAAATIGAVIYGMTRGNDVMSPGAGSGYGSRTLMGPEGAIALNNKDTVIAGTDLFSGGEQQGASNSIGGVDLTPLVTEIRQMKAEVSTVLKQILNKEGTVTLDGSKVGSALVLGSYKSS